MQCGAHVDIVDQTSHCIRGGEFSYHVSDCQQFVKELLPNNIILLRNRVYHEYQMVTAVWEIIVGLCENHVKQHKFSGRTNCSVAVGTCVSAPVQTGPRTHLASYKIGTGSFPRVKRPGRGVDHPPSTSAELKAIPRSDLCGLLYVKLCLLPVIALSFGFKRSVLK